MQKNGIEYFLAGDTLRYMVEEGRIDQSTGCAYVIMTGENCIKFIEVCKRTMPADREIEYWGNSQDYPRFSLRYVASDTTSFDMLDYLGYQTHGMHIEIEILRGEEKNYKAAGMRALEKGLMLNTYGNAAVKLFVSKSGYRKYRLYYNMVKIIKGKLGLRRTLFDYFTKESQQPSEGKYSLCHNGKIIKDIPTSYFEGAPRKHIVYGTEFSIPVESESLIKRIPDGNTDTFITDEKRGYRETIKELKIKRKELLKIHESDLRFESIEHSKKKYLSHSRKDWQVVLQTDARFRMWKQYMPQKDSIMKFYESQDFESLSKIFKEYDDEIENLMPYKRSFSFDNDIMNIYINVLKNTGQGEKAEKIISWVPESHLKEIIHESN